MVMRMKLKYNINIFAILYCSIYSIYADKQKVATEKNTPSKMNYSIKPSGINIGLDIFTTIYNYVTHWNAAKGFHFHHYCLHTDIDFNRIYLDVDFDYMNYHISAIPGEKYENEYASYKGGEGQAKVEYDDRLAGFRLGCGITYNCLHKNRNHNAIVFGAMFNFAHFKDNITGGQLRNYDSKSIFESTIESNNANTFYNVLWPNLCVSARLTIWNHFYIGNALQVNFLRSNVRNGGNTIPYIIPGFGKEEDSVTYQFKFFVGFTIPLFDDPKFDDKDKKYVIDDNEE